MVAWLNADITDENIKIVEKEIKKISGISETTFRTKDSSGNPIYGIAYCVPINAVLEYINN